MTYYDAAAEHGLLGAAIMSPRIVERVKLADADFAQPVNGALWTAIGLVHAAGLTPDPSTVRPHLPAQMIEPVLRLMGSILGAGVVGNVDTYVEAILEQAHRRRLLDAMVGARQKLDQSAEDASAYLERALGQGPMERAADKAMTLDEFIDRDLPSEEWVIPDLLARGERFVLTGVEGFGKSVLMRTIGVMAAAGLDPFTLRNTERRKVLLVDCENPDKIMRDRLAPIRQIARNRGREIGTNMWIRRYGRGLNLSEPTGRRELRYLCETFRPDLLLIGPAYQLYIGGANTREEDLARQVTSALDELRAEYGFALILEHHSPHGDGQDTRTVRPIGSSLWLRWPEFGMGLRPQKGTKPEDRQGELVPWRGARDDRPWPKQLVAGGLGNVPWIDPARLRAA